jgi:peptidoglycan-associated lipoprotein
MRRQTDLRALVLFGSVLIIASCASETAKKPDTFHSLQSPVSQEKSPAGKSSGSASQSQAGSSLDAHREGKGMATGPLKEILFDFDSYDLTPQARSVLQANAEWLKANPSTTVEIEGHCDERGTTEYNLALGAKRARAALDFLVSLGISPTRIKTTSYGEELPSCKESNENCYEKNRRDRFVEARARTAF